MYARVHQSVWVYVHTGACDRSVLSRMQRNLILLCPHLSLPDDKSNFELLISTELNVQLMGASIPAVYTSH